MNAIPTALDTKSCCTYEEIHDSFSRGVDLVVLEGSARSGKTFSALQFFVVTCLEGVIDNVTGERRGCVVEIFRQKRVWVRSLIPDFLKILRDLWQFHPERWNKSELMYTFPNGSTIQFLGLEDGQKSADGRKAGQSLQGGNRDFYFINEAIECPYAAWKQINIRTKIGGVMDFNPSTAEHWLFSRVEKNMLESQEDDDLLRVEWHHSTFLDNPFIEDKIRRSLLAMEPTPRNVERGTADRHGWLVYGLGVRCSPQGLIYPQYTIIDDIPEGDFDFITNGQDFGYSDDPNALVQVFVRGHNLYLHELVYQYGLNTVSVDKAEELQDLETGQARSLESAYKIAGLNAMDEIFADSSQSSDIGLLRARRWNIQAVKKKPANMGVGVAGTSTQRGFVLSSINLFKSFHIHITAPSINLIKEVKNYKWKPRGDGDGYEAEPIKGWDHGLDAARYALWMTVGVARGLVDVADTSNDEMEV